MKTVFYFIVNIFARLYKKMVVNKRKEISFWVLYSFLISFGLLRLIVHLFPAYSVFEHFIEEVHIHHFVPGLFLLALIGFLALNDFHHKKTRLMGFFYGVGLGLSFDEFGLWLYLDDNYWVRASYDAIVIIFGFLFSWVYFGKFWLNFLRRVKNVLVKFFWKK